MARNNLEELFSKYLRYEHYLFYDFVVCMTSKEEVLAGGAAAFIEEWNEDEEMSERFTRFMERIDYSPSDLTREAVQSFLGAAVKDLK